MLRRLALLAALTLVAIGLVPTPAGANTEYDHRGACNASMTVTIDASYQHDGYASWVVGDVGANWYNNFTYPACGTGSPYTTGSYTMTLLIQRYTYGGWLACYYAPWSGNGPGHTFTITENTPGVLNSPICKARNYPAEWTNVWTQYEGVYQGTFHVNVASAIFH